MADQVTNYQCPSCTGPLHFGGESGMLECEYCGSSFSVDDIEQMYAEKNEHAAENAQTAENVQSGEWDMNEAGEEWGSDGEDIRAYNCPSCGAELLTDDTTAATSCPYCGNPTIIPGQVSGSRKPDYIIPFKMNKEAAIAALRKHYSGRILLPRSFAAENHIQEVKGVYVPFWLFDASVDGDMTFRATRTHVRTTPTETITETDHYLVHRAGSMEFKNVPVDGSSKMPDGHMDAIEPFDYTELKPFSMSYLPGYLADRYDMSADECMKRANDRCAASAEAALRNTVQGYSSVSTVKKNVAVYPEGVQYAMMPVWLLSTKWKDKNYLFAMNGQSGRLIGDLPVDMGKLMAICAGVFAVVSAASWFISRYLFG